jgi:glc operon protein GlcG
MPFLGKVALSALGALTAFGAVWEADAQTADKKALAVAAAQQMVSLAAAEARKAGSGGSFAVVDDGGDLIAFARIDGTFAASARIAIGKARTAAVFQRPTAFFEDIINAKGRTAMTTLVDVLPEFTPLQGGIPIVLDGKVVGAIGVSGAKSAQHDEELAQKVVDAVMAGGKRADAVAPAAGVAHFDRGTVDERFARGAPIIETAGYKVHASRRDKPGVAELHMHEADVIYVLDGRATLVTGGSVVDPKTTEPGEIRGPSIQGGVARQLAKGDVVTVPPGTPHWFKDVMTAPFLYFVVKPISGKEQG